jgi:hypothetical protein
MYRLFYLFVAIAFLNLEQFECLFHQHESDAIYENVSSKQKLHKIFPAVKEESLREADDDDSQWNKKSPYANFTCDEENLKKFYDGKLNQRLFEQFNLNFHIYNKNKKKENIPSLSL